MGYDVRTLDSQQIDELVEDHQKAQLEAFLSEEDESRTVFICHICGGKTSVAPEPPEKAICEICCGRTEVGHEYEHCVFRRSWFCKRCDGEVPPDHYLLTDVERGV